MQERRGSRSYYNQGTVRKQYAFPARREPAEPPTLDADAPTAAPRTRKLAPAKKSRKFIIAGVTAGIVIAILIVAGGTLFFIRRDSGPIPKNVRQSVSFPVYYPSTLPQGYRLQKNSFSVQDNIIFYHLTSGDNTTIVISEQTSPPNPLDLKSSPGFNEVPTTAGEAAAGMVNGAPVAILVTEKTMVNIQGTKNTSQDMVAKLAQSMSAPD